MSAAKWEQEHQKFLDAIKTALKEKDRYSAEDILEKIAPHPVGENVFVKENPSHEGLFTTASVFVIKPGTNVLDNPNGVARIKRDGTRMWYMNGMLHNSKGPAVIYPSGKVEYYYAGQQLNSAQDLDSEVQSALDHAARSKSVRNP